MLHLVIALCLISPNAAKCQSVRAETMYVAPKVTHPRMHLVCKGDLTTEYTCHQAIESSTTRQEAHMSRVH
jgi:hypothetical protein